MKQITDTLIVFLLGGIAITALWWGMGFFDRPQVEITRKVYVDRPLLRRDTVRVVVPSIETTYAVQTDTVEVCHAAPAGTDIGGLITPKPITRHGHSLVLTYWRPHELRWVQETYTPPEPRFHAALDGEVGYKKNLLGPDALMARLRAEAGYRRAYVFAEPEASLDVRGPSLSATVGVGVTLAPWNR